MKTLKRVLIASLFIAINVHLTLAMAQNEAKNASEDALGSCPAPDEMTALHLYGTWQVSWAGLNGSATLSLARNPDYPDGVRGSISRAVGLAPPEALVAGDVDKGVFTLDESTDGKAISAIWSGEVVAGSCGRQITGIWTRTSDRAEHRFVLRRQSGWN